MYKLHSGEKEGLSLYGMQLQWQKFSTYILIVLSNNTNINHFSTLCRRDLEPLQMQVRLETAAVRFNSITEIYYIKYNMNGKM